MKANIPDLQTEDVASSKSTPSMELEGVYLRAMQDISSRLMEDLPAEDSLWQTLSQAESLLLEAQLSGVSPQNLFGGGGVAGFCQSIVDEYNQKRAGEARDIPAARDPALRKVGKTPEPRSTIMIRRKRRATAALITAFSLIFAILAVWYVGLLDFWTKGSRYYLDELYHFSDTATPVSDQPIQFFVLLEPSGGLAQTIYTDGEGTDLVLTAISCTELLREVEVETETTEETENAEGTDWILYEKSMVWCVSIRYPVKVGYTKISYVEPSAKGTAVLTMPDGETMTFAVSAFGSGPSGEGYEYISIEIAELPTSVRAEGATVLVTLDPPRAVEWKRTGAGWR